MIQCFFLLAITAHLTGLKPAKVVHHMVNCHIYENQLELVKEQLSREPFEMPKLYGIENITYEDLMEGTVTDKLSVEGYQYHPPINYPFTA